MKDFYGLKKFMDKNGLIIFDTNVFLNLYNFSVETTKEIINQINDIKQFLWLPRQVDIEFESNKSRVINKSFDKYKVIKKDVNKILDSTISSLYSTLGKCDRFKYPQFDVIIQNAIKNIKSSAHELNKVDEEIANEKELSLQFIQNDVVEGLINYLKESGKIGKGFNHLELINIYVEGDTRYKLGIPPGFKDTNKMIPNKDLNDYENKRKAYGDLIIWKEVLNKAQETNLDILYITDDEKEDWWKIDIEVDKRTGRDSKKLVGPHDELIKEIKCYTNKDFFLLNFAHFLEQLSSLNKRKESIHLHYELNKLHILDYFIQNQIINEDIKVNYIIKDLDSYFDYEAIDYHLSIDNISFPDKENIHMEIMGNEVSISGIFILELTVDGTIIKKEEKVIKSVLFNIDGECSLILSLDKDDHKNYSIIKHDIKILNSINDGIVAEISDDIDVYEIYDVKKVFDKAQRKGSFDKITDYQYKLYEAFYDIEFYSLEDYMDYIHEVENATTD